MHIASDQSFTVLRQINILICFRVTLEHLQLLNRLWDAHLREGSMP